MFYSFDDNKNIFAERIRLSRLLKQQNQTPKHVTGCANKTDEQDQLVFGFSFLFKKKLRILIHIFIYMDLQLQLDALPMSQML